MTMNQSQLIGRCRRGIRELDVLFGQFLESDYPTRPLDEQIIFQRLLDVQDPVIMDWLFGKYESDDRELQTLIVRLQKISGLNKDNK